MTEATLFQRHRVIATLIVLALFGGAVGVAVLRIPALEEAEASARRQAAAQEFARLKADFGTNKDSIVAGIRAALAGGRLDAADAQLKKYRPVANGALDDLNAEWERERLVRK